MAKKRANGEGSIRKKPNGRWEGRYTQSIDPSTGRAIQKSVSARTQAECKEKLAKAIRDNRGIPVNHNEDYTVAEWCSPRCGPSGCPGCPGWPGPASPCTRPVSWRTRFSGWHGRWRGRSPGCICPPSGRWAFCGCCPRRLLVSLPLFIPPLRLAKRLASLGCSHALRLRALSATQTNTTESRK